MTFGQRLEKSRKDARLKMKDVSKQMNIASSTLSRYETDTREPNLETCISLSNLYNVNLHWLVTGDMPETKITYEINEDEKKLLDRYRQATDFKKGRVWGILDE